MSKLTPGQVDIQYEAAYDLFKPIVLNGNKPESHIDDPLPDMDGKNCMFIGAGFPFYKKTAEELNKVSQEQNQNLKRILSVCVRLANELGKDNPDISSSWDTWQKIFTSTGKDPKIPALPLMIFHSNAETPYHKKVKASEVPKEVLNLITDVSPLIIPAAVISNFHKWLITIKDKLKLELDKPEKKYQVTSVTHTCEPDPNNEDAALPLLSARILTLTGKSKFLNARCASDSEVVELAFDYKELTYEFDYEQLKNSEGKKKFDSFVNGHKKYNLNSSIRYFDGNHPWK